MPEAVIVATARTPIGRAMKGSLTEMRPDDLSAQIINADVPLAALFGYATSLRSLTKGRASYTMEPHCFEIVPETIKQSLLNR